MRKYTSYKLILLIGGSSKWAATTLFALLTFCSFGSMKQARFEKDSTKTYPLNDPRNPNCPCHKLQELADNEFAQIMNSDNLQNIFNNIGNPIQTSNHLNNSDIQTTIHANINNEIQQIQQAVFQDIQINRQSNNSGFSVTQLTTFNYTGIETNQFLFRTHKFKQKYFKWKRKYFARHFSFIKRSKIVSACYSWK